MRDFGAGVAVIEALLARQIIRRARHRQITGGLRPRRLNLRPRQVSEEARDTGIFFLGAAAQHPQRRAADDGVLRIAHDFRAIGQETIADLEFGVLQDVGARR